MCLVGAIRIPCIDIGYVCILEEYADMHRK